MTAQPSGGSAAPPARDNHATTASTAPTSAPASSPPATPAPSLRMGCEMPGRRARNVPASIRALTPGTRGRTRPASLVTRTPRGESLYRSCAFQCRKRFCSRSFTSGASSVPVEPEPLGQLVAGVEERARRRLVEHLAVFPHDGALQVHAPSAQSRTMLRASRPFKALRVSTRSGAASPPRRSRTPCGRSG